MGLVERFELFEIHLTADIARDTSSRAIIVFQTDSKILINSIDIVLSYPSRIIKEHMHMERSLKIKPHNNGS